MDFFKTLPDEAIESILLFCRGKEVMRMMEASKRIKDLVLNNSKLMGKIRLILYLREDMDIVGMIQLVESHKFSALRLKFNSSETIIEKLPSNYDLVLELLSKSVVEIVLSMSGSIEDCETLMRKFLPKIKECSIDNSRIQNLLLSYLDEQATEAFFDSPSRIQSSSLKVLKIHDSGISFLKCFAACNSVHTFEMIYAVHELDIFSLNAFLSRQHKLKAFLAVHRDFSFYENYRMQTIHSSWANMKFRLEKFEVIGGNLIDEIAAMNFFKAQQDLKIVKLTPAHQKRELFSSILALPKLEKFQADGCDCIICAMECSPLPYNTEKNTVVLKLLDFPDKLLRFLEPSPDHKPIVFSYKPEMVDISERFEENVLNFVALNSSRIKVINIGSESWRHQEFELSLEFCKTLVQVCPDLKGLKLFNVQSSKEFSTFLLGYEQKPKSTWLF